MVSVGEKAVFGVIEKGEGPFLNLANEGDDSERSNSDSQNAHGPKPRSLSHGIGEEPSQPKQAGCKKEE
jgi:hypothetical protein